MPSLAELLALPAGAELDEWIAVNICGLKPDSRGHWRLLIDGVHRLFRMPPPFSTREEVAVMLKERVGVSFMATAPWKKYLKWDSASYERAPTHVPSLPLAITRAALAAWWEQKGEQP